MEDVTFKWISGLGTVGVLLMIIWFVFHKYIPQMQDRYEAILTKAQDLNVSQAKEFHETLRAIVTENSKNISALTSALEGVKTEIRTQTVTLQAAINNSHQ